MPSIINKEKIANTRISFSAIFYGKLNQIQSDPIEELAMVVPSSTDTEQYNWMGTVPGFDEWKDERKLGTLRAEGFSLRNRDWSNGLRVHKNDITDDKLGQVRPRIEMLAIKARQHRPRLLVDTLINGFDGSNPEIGDGLAYDGAFFFSDDHQDGEGPRQSNLSNRRFSGEAFEELYQRMSELGDEEGDPLDIAPTHILVGPKYRSTVRRLLNAELVNEGGVAVSNIHQGAVSPLISPRLVGRHADYWFMLDLSQPVRPLIFQDREPIVFGALEDLTAEHVFMRKQFLYGSQARYAVGYGLWQFSFGSTGEVA